jgi:hypothetical protein
MIHVVTSEASRASDVPTDWPAVTSEMHAHAKARALEALAFDGARRAQDRLAVYYDLESNYAGATFANLAPNDWWDITPTDLQATSLMRVDFEPRATRRLTSPGQWRNTVLRSLRPIPDRNLADADADTLLAMETFYRAVKSAISSPQSRAPRLVPGSPSASSALVSALTCFPCAIATYAGTSAS